MLVTKGLGNLEPIKSDTKFCKIENWDNSITDSIFNIKGNEKKLTKFDSEKLKIKSGEKPLTKKELEVLNIFFMDWNLMQSQVT